MNLDALIFLFFWANPNKIEPNNPYTAIGLSSWSTVSSFIQLYISWKKRNLCSTKPYQNHKPWFGITNITKAELNWAEQVHDLHILETHRELGGETQHFILISDNPTYQMPQTSANYPISLNYLFLFFLLLLLFG